MINTLDPYFLIGGDFAPIGEVAHLLKSSDFVVCEEFRKVISGSVFFALNLEAPFTLASRKALKSGPNLKADPSVLMKVKEIGADYFFLANNHIMDFGDQGLLDTMEACRELGICTTGAGTNLEEASKPLICHAEGFKVGILNIAEREFGSATDSQPGFSPIDLMQNTRQIHDLRERCDILVVSVHGGIEYYPLPRPGLRDLCQFFVDEGADAVVCHHSHVASAYEVYAEKPIFYGMGNFLFSKDNSDSSWETGYCVKFAVDRIKKNISGFSVLPYRQSVTLNGVKALSGDDYSRFMEGLQRLNADLEDAAIFAERWRKYCLEQSIDYLIPMFFPFFHRPVTLLRRIPWLRKLLLFRKRTLVRLNLVRCESHSEVLRQILEHST